MLDNSKDRGNDDSSDHSYHQTWKSMKTYIILTAALFAGFAVLAGYYVFTCNTEIDFKLNWNMFKSFLMWPLYILGLVVSFGVKFPQFVPIIKWINPETGKTEKIEENRDITETLMAKVVVPLLMFFVFVPLMAAAAIYYPLMCLIWIFGYIFPVLICAFYLITLVIYYKWETKLLDNFKNYYAMPLVAAVTAGIIWFFTVNWIPNTDKAELVTDICAGSLVVISTALYIVFVRKYKPDIQAAATSEAADASPASEPADTVEVKKGQSFASRGFVMMYSILFLALFVIVIFFKKEDTSAADRNYVAEVAEQIEGLQADNNRVTEKKVLPAEYAAMNGWKIESLKQNVKKITYDNGTFKEFNQDGNIIRDKYAKDIVATENKYVSSVRFINDEGAYNIEFGDKIRSEVWDSGTEERMSDDYTFDSQGRIRGKVLGGYGWMPSTVFYYDGDAFLPAKTVTQFRDESGSLTVTETYKYTRLDEWDNWTSRLVGEERVEETGEEGEEPKTVRKTSERTETRTIDYFTAEEMNAGVKYVPDKRK